MVGQRLTAQLVAFAEPSLATSILVFHPHVTGIVAETKTLPNSFLVKLFTDPRIAAPTRLATVKLTVNTKIKNALGADLKASDITLGAQVDAVGDMAPGSNEMTAEYVIVLGLEINGATATTEVDVQAKTFVVTADGGAKVKVGVNEKTSIAVSSAGKVQLVRADEFIKLLANKAYTVYAFGLKDSSGIVQALTIRAEEKK